MENISPDAKHIAEKPLSIRQKWEKKWDKIIKYQITLPLLGFHEIEYAIKSNVAIEEIKNLDN